MTKRFLILITCFLTIASVAICQNYDYHMSDLRVFRINLGSSRGPTTNEVTTYGLLPGQFVVNTYDDTTYIVIDGSSEVAIASNGTVTVDGIVMDELTVQGDVDIDQNLTPTSGVLRVKLPAAASTALGTIALRSLEAVSDRTDSDYVLWDLFEAYDSQTNWQKFAYLKIISTDIDHGSEDCNIELWYDIAGTPTLGAVWDSGGLTIKQLKVEGAATFQGAITMVDKSLDPEDIDVTDAYIIVGNSGATGTAVAVSGDLALANDGGMTIQPLAVEDGMVALASTYIIVGDAGGTGLAQTVGGDLAIDNAGDFTIQPVSVEEGMIALASTKFLVGNGGGTSEAVNASDDIGLANDGAMTIQPLAVEEGMIALASGTIFIGDAGGTGLSKLVSGDITLSAAGAVSVTNVADALMDTKIAAVTSVYGSATSVNGAIAGSQVIVTNAITMLDIAGDTLAAYTLTRVWMSESAKGAVSTNNIEALTLSTGSAVSTETANGDYYYVTAVGGTAVATITATANGTNYVNVGVGPRVTSTEIIFSP